MTTVGSVPDRVPTVEHACPQGRNRTTDTGIFSPDAGAANPAPIQAKTTARAGYKSRPHEEHLAQLSSSDTPVVVMEPTEYGDCVDASLCRERPWNRLLVPET